jgi:hypothetical protein
MISPTYPEEYLDIDFLAGILFDYNYNSSSESSRCYELDTLDPKNITIEDVKLIPDKTKQKQLVNSIFNANIKWQWRKKNIYMFKRQADVYSMNVQLQLVNDLEAQSSLKSPENMNSLVSWLLSDLVVTKKTKGILLNIMNLDVGLDLLMDFLDNYPEIYADFKDIQDKKNKMINVTISEHFFKTDLLSEIASSLTWEQLVAIIFQVGHVIALAQQAYPGFRKNNLTCDTVLLYSKKPKTNVYSVGKDQIKMSDEGYEVKLGFFSDSYIPKFADNDGLEDNKKELDNTYDLLVFLNDLEKIVTDLNCKQNIKEIIGNIQNNSKNIILSNIIMNPSFFNIQKGGEKVSKSRTIKGVRYLNSDSMFLKSNSRDTGRELPDSLSSLDSVESPSYKASGSNYNMGMGQMPMDQMSMAQMQMPMGPMGQMQMPMGPMGQMQMPMGQMAQMGQMHGLNANNSQPIDINSMAGFGNTNAQISNDQLVKLGIMAPMGGLGGLAKTSADLRIGQMGGSSGSTEYIDIAKPNFFF